MPRGQTLLERFNDKHTRTPDCWPWTGAKTSQGYGEIWDGVRVVKAHRMSYQLHVGPIPGGMLVDHICMNKGCVNPDHLRLATRKQNNEHLAGPRSNGASGYRGVSLHKQSGKWQAYVRHNDQQLYLGLHATAEQAAEVAKAARLDLFTHNDIDRKAA